MDKTKVLVIGWIISAFLFGMAGFADNRDGPEGLSALFFLASLFYFIVASIYQKAKPIAEKAITEKELLKYRELFDKKIITEAEYSKKIKELKSKIL